MTETTNPACAAGAAQLVRTGLRLQTGQEVLVVCDETTHDVALMLADAASDVGAIPGLFLVPLRQQRAGPSGNRLSSALRAAIVPCSAMFNVLDAGQETLPFRRALLDVATNSERAIAHMPGATLGVLAAANEDDSEMDRRNIAVARGLALGRHLRIETRDVTGREYGLDLDIGGWARAPVLSGKAIRRGTWGNLPGGEVYLTPVSADGELLVDGSVDNMPLHEGIVVSFSAGRMVDVAPGASPAALFLRELATRFSKDGGPNWNCLAEFGIGTNGSLRELATTAMLNEKVLGTCHVALGDSHRRGGERSSDTQVQLVCRAPSIVIDGTTWIDRGNHVYDLLDPGEDYASIGDCGDCGRWRVERSGYHVQFEGKRLYRVWFNDANSRHRFSVGNHHTARLAATLCRALPPRGEACAAELGAQTGIDTATVGQVLSIMLRYQVIELHH